MRCERGSEYAHAHACAHWLRYSLTISKVSRNVKMLQLVHIVHLCNKIYHSIQYSITNYHNSQIVLECNCLGEQGNVFGECFLYPLCPHILRCSWKLETLRISICFVFVSCQPLLFESHLHCITNHDTMTSIAAPWRCS